MVSLTRASELVARLSRTRNYPREDAGVADLARGLQKASNSLNIGAGRIVDRCAETSEFCPTDHDLIQVARDLAREDAVAAGTFDSLSGAGNCAQNTAKWKQEYGEPVAFEWTKIDGEKAKRVRDRERALIAAIKAKYPGELSWLAMSEAAEELGYHDYAVAWRRAMAGAK